MQTVVNVVLLILWEQSKNNYSVSKQEHKEELQQQIGYIFKNIVQISELYHVLEAMNKGIELTNHYTLRPIENGQKRVY